MEEFSALVGALIGGALVWLFGGWLAMLLIGAAHASDARVPAFGYGTVLWLSLAIGIVVGGSARAGTN